MVLPSALSAVVTLHPALTSHAVLGDVTERGTGCLVVAGVLLGAAAGTLSVAALAGRRARRRDAAAPPCGPAPSLEQSPLTGLPLIDLPLLDLGRDVPRSRVRTTGTALTPATSDRAHTRAPSPGPSGMPASAPMRASEVGRRLADAWRVRDVDELAALAGASTMASRAAHVLAGVAAQLRSDPRAVGYLSAALAAEGALEDDPFLEPFLTQLRVTVSRPALALACELAVGDDSLRCWVAAAELEVGDAGSAYEVLEPVTSSGLADVLRAEAALALGWPGLALGATSTSDLDLRTPVGAAGLLLHVRALHAGGEAGAALHAAGDLVAHLEEDASDLLPAALFARASAAADAGDVDVAWEDLTRLLRMSSEDHPASELLKKL